ncbi:hypothetical protein CH72_1132 [Burkholderia ambifaria AMMD]|nr:hypothetical protein CH72_1132 [Burkholderia ambifaria AMMD]
MNESIWGALSMVGIIGQGLISNCASDTLFHSSTVSKSKQ